MKRKENNYAFIDSQNVNLSIRSLGWKLDFAWLRAYLKEKYAVTKVLKHLIDKNKLGALIIPNRFKFSALLNFRICRPFLKFMNDLKIKLEYKKEKAP